MFRSGIPPERLEDPPRGLHRAHALRPVVLDHPARISEVADLQGTHRRGNYHHEEHCRYKQGRTISDPESSHIQARLDACIGSQKIRFPRGLETKSFPIPK